MSSIAANGKVDITGLKVSVESKTETIQHETPILNAKDVNIYYTDYKNGKITHAVENVDLKIRNGEFVTIVGLSGCGKSSFLNAVAGLIKTESGDIHISGKKINGPGKDRAVVFQKPSLLPWRTVIENITYGIELRGVKKKKAAETAAKYVDLVRLNGFENSYPHQLSGGMQQRVNLARALVCEPEILLLDEPFSALDAITRETMQYELLRLAEATGKTILMVTHQIDEAVLLSDRVIVFSERPGKIVEDVTINIPRPRSPQVKATSIFGEYTAKIWNMIYQEYYI